MSPFDEGVAAARAGRPKEDNPHKRGTDAHSEWASGYKTALEADEATTLDEDADPS